ncbi:amidohydrolase family protein [Saccharothrix deserti]|uniref:amidohydrolase family protein n=1 Tax=Saccharothrix deserti TaxID=2593674 RepID=UPI00131DCD81|nr:amidohydrolase family protein [Saccharothrix deserti]
MIVDAQVHLWAADSPDRPWPGDGRGMAHRDVPPTVAETLAVLDDAGVDRAVLVPPSWEGDRNDVVLDAARRHPDRFAVMGRIPLDPAARTLSGWRESGMLGVRLTLHREPWRTVFSTGGLDWFWAAASAVELPVMVYGPGLSGPLRTVARRYRGVRLVVDHLNVPLGTTGPDAFAHLPDLLALADLPNVAVKATALPCHSARRYPFTDLHDPLRQVIEAFGPDRVFWGSDWTRLPCAYTDNLRLFTEAVPYLGGAERDLVLGGALLTWLGWTRVVNGQTTT